MKAVDYYLKTWVGDYDEQQWSSFIKLDHYDNSASGSDNNVNVVLFMYHPHGKPTATIAWAEAGDQDLSGGSSNKEDIYWIYYAPRTSSNGKLKGRELDGYVMGAWVSSELDHAFDGAIGVTGDASGTNDDPISDLIYMYEPN